MVVGAWLRSGEKNVDEDEVVPPTGMNATKHNGPRCGTTTDIARLLEFVDRLVIWASVAALGNDEVLVAWLSLR